MDFNVKDEIIAITPLWKGERLPDGRPKVDEKYLRALKNLTLEEVWKPIFVKGYESQFEGRLHTLHDDGRKLIGRAVTATYCPFRPDLDEVVKETGKRENRTGTYYQWVIDTLGEYDVPVIDMYDKIYKGTFLGGNLTTAIKNKTRNENGGAVISTGISVTIRPHYDKAVSLSYDGEYIRAEGARIIDGNTMVPARAVAEHIGLSAKYDEEYRAVSLSLGDKYIFFNVDTTYTTVFGNDIQAPYPTKIIDGEAYIPLRTLADALGSSLEVKDNYTYLDINITKSPVMEEYFTNSPVNQWGISSRTNYMVWVSLGEYKVRLFEGSQYKWRQILEAPCAIGAPSTPSITGSYEYQYKARWDYGTYYVGPCLVFHGGYALHSVLLNQNGTEYDGRVGVGISHGCIRLKKKDIDFIANTIPVGTRIYLTY